MRIVIAWALMMTLAMPAVSALAQPTPGNEGGVVQDQQQDSDDQADDQSARNPRLPELISRDRFDKAVTAMFVEADANRDGIVTLAELNAIFESRREAVSRQKFKNIDTDGNGVISMDEFLKWRKGLGSAAQLDAGTMENRGEQVPEELWPVLSKKDFALHDVIEPLSATLIAKANTDYDAGLSLKELLLYEGQRFDAADANHDGYLEPEELQRADSGSDEGRPATGKRP